MTGEQSREVFHVQRPRCPFCHDDVRPEDEKAACSSCMAWHHEACWGEHGGCSACGAGRATGRSENGTPSPPVIRRDLPGAEAPRDSAIAEVAVMDDEAVRARLAELEPHSVRRPNFPLLFGLAQLSFWTLLELTTDADLFILCAGMSVISLVFVAWGLKIRSQRPGSGDSPRLASIRNRARLLRILREKDGKSA